LGIEFLPVRHTLAARWGIQLKEDVSTSVLVANGVEGK
jgi:hypothetical protein